MLYVCFKVNTGARAPVFFYIYSSCIRIRIRTCIIKERKAILWVSSTGLIKSNFPSVILALKKPPFGSPKTFSQLITQPKGFSC